MSSDDATTAESDDGFDSVGPSALVGDVATRMYRRSLRRLGGNPEQAPPHRLRLARGRRRCGPAPRRSPKMALDHEHTPKAKAVQS